MSHRYTLFGNPVEHSLSPRIHQLFAEQTHRQISYTTTTATAETFTEQVNTFFADGGRGCNVTVPFKENAAALCKTLSPAAELAGAANTLLLDADGAIIGHNTDGTGLVTDLSANLTLELRDKHVLIAGAGGASRGILGPLLEQSPAQILVANRSTDKAAALAERFSHLGVVAGIGFDEIPTGQPFDLVINATSLGLQNDKPTLPASVLHRQTIGYDLMYGKDTAFMQWVREHGAIALDGLGMLLEQAADAYELWEGVRPKSRLMRSRL
ncbi:MAG: shikimate dehydrogenase [Gammaproteobacteria bacterium]|nr:shikimate dehydrogenase [Gammaproteobacteria bacterium]